MATFWERAAHSVYRTSLCILTYCNFSFSNFGFEGGTLVMIASGPDHCLSFTFYYIKVGSLLHRRVSMIFLGLDNRVL